MKKYLRAEIGARYWEDSKLNGVPDKEGNMPLKEGGYWKVDIELSSGKICNWREGSTASLHYKSADQNNFYLLDENKEITHKYENEYVIDAMCPEEKGYGNYVIMDIDKNGFIKGFKDLTDDIEWEDVLTD